MLSAELVQLLLSFQKSAVRLIKSLTQGQQRMELCIYLIVSFSFRADVTAVFCNPVQISVQHNGCYLVLSKRKCRWLILFFLAQFYYSAIKLRTFRIGGSAVITENEH